MNTTVNNLFEFYRDMNSHDLQMIFEGDFNQEVTKYVLSITEKSFEANGIDAVVRKKVFNVMIEGLQNICKHQYAAQEPDTESFIPATFMIGVSDGDYFIITGNIISNDVIPALTEKIDHINALDKDGLKVLYKEARLKSKISEVGGAGLGLIDMARKSGNKFAYRFDPAGAETSFFSIKTVISSKKEEQ